MKNYTRANQKVRPVWWVFLFGGRCKFANGSNCYSPGVYPRTIKWYREEWYKHRSWWSFVRIGQNL